MKYDEVMAIHNLKQKNIGDVLEENDIKDIEILINLCNRQINELNDFYVRMEKKDELI